MTYAQNIAAAAFPWLVPVAGGTALHWWFLAAFMLWGAVSVICMSGMYRNLPTWGPRHVR